VSLRIEPCTRAHEEGWLLLRRALWPEGSAAEHLQEMAEFLLDSQRFVQFVALDGAQRPVAFVEASLRADYVNGTESSPVAFLEGLYVLPEHRRQGVARALVAAVTAWGVSRGCRELASDALLENKASHAVHEALGFAETERVVYFRKALAPG